MSPFRRTLVLLVIALLMVGGLYLITRPRPVATGADGGKLASGEEAHVRVTNPDARDTDKDLIPDAMEEQGRRLGFDLDPRAPNSLSRDTDDDGLSDINEMRHATNMLSWDTDGDGVSDGAEVAQGSRPADASDRGVAPPPDELVEIQLVIGDHSATHSERYHLVVGPIHHQARQFAVVSEAVYQFRSARTYAVQVIHAASDVSVPDFDYIAQIFPTDPNACVCVKDPDGILGFHDESDFFRAENKSAELQIARVGMKIEGDDNSARLIVEISEPVDLTLAKVAIHYDASDPSLAVGRAAGADGFDLIPATGALRIWTKDASKKRDGAGLRSGGDFVEPGVEYRPSELGIDPSHRVATFHVEAVAVGQSANGQIIGLEVKWNPNDPSSPICRDEVLVETMIGAREN